jgi:dipeptidyl aminopeptidase/acylaminoacyl peptidase
MSIIVENVSFRSEGHELVGRIYRPNEPGRFPAVLICHGYPGDNKNMDLAEELALNGIVALIFYYRGAWGSGGQFRLRGLEPSTRDAVEHLLSFPYVDGDRVGLIGYSMGAVPAAARLSSDPRLRTGVFISPASDLGALAPRESLDAVVPVFLNMGRGKLAGLEAGAVKEDLSWVLENQNPVDMIGRVWVPVLVLVGSNDQMTPLTACRMLYDAANEPKEWLLIEGASHEYSEHRMPLIIAVLNWLKKHL